MNAQMQLMMKTSPGSSLTPVQVGQLQRKQRSSTNLAEPSSVPPVVHEVLNSPGQPLDNETRAFMELRFGHDFSKVRVHTDSSAFESANDLDAIAYTSGRHIVFGKGQYAPATQRGRHVLAHELAHTLQQQSGSPGALHRIQRIPKDPQGVPFEGEIIPWSAALRESPDHSSKVLADLPRGHKVSIRGGRYWILVETVVDGTKLSGYVSHELIRKASVRQASAETAAEEAAEKSANEKLAKSEPDKFSYNPGLDPELKARFNRMVIALDEKGIKHDGIADVRSKKLAHILSTGYHIHETATVSLKVLQALKDGKDIDGNIWYKKEWEQVSTYLGFGSPRAATDAEILEKVKDNAFALVKNQGTDYIKGGKVNCAYEGYEMGDAQRLPNVSDVPISNHVNGRAIDLSGIEWGKLGGEWSDDARKFVASFGLTRPYSPEAKTYCTTERWHFELEQGK